MPFVLVPHVDILHVSEETPEHPRLSCHTDKPENEDKCHTIPGVKPGQFSPRCPLKKPADVEKRVRHLGDLYAESGQTLQGSFSAVSKPNFASKYSLELAICSKRRLRKGIALAEIYIMHSFAPFWNPMSKRAWEKEPLDLKNPQRKRGEKEARKQKRAET